MPYYKIIQTSKALEIHRPCVNISKKPCTLAVVLWGLVVDVAVLPCWLGTEEIAEFGFGVGTRVVGGGAGLDGLLNWEGDCDRPVRCSLLEDTVGEAGEGRRGIAGVADAAFPKFVFVVVVSVPME